MATYPVPYAEVARSAAKNRAGVWYRAGANPADPEGLFAFQRLRREVFEPIIEPSFSVSSQSKFFMMGSCFARGLETALHASGLTMLSRSEKFNEFETAVEGVTALGSTNRYNTASIANEFRWALDSSHHFPEDAILELPDGLCFDPHMTPTLKMVDRDGTLARRAIFGDVASSIKEADVIILTLGLVEVWRDTLTGLVTNTAPDARVVKMNRERFVFDVLRYGENLANMEEIYSLLQKYGKPGHKIVITVSPVPLGRTFTDQDIVVANTYSKSTLRSVAGDFADDHDNLDYFPAYEIVMNSDRASSWIEDMRHPKGALAQKIIKAFVSKYIAGTSASDVALNVEYVA